MANKERIKSSAEQRQKVLDFEPTANEAEWLGFNQSSGSTGKPKLQVFRNSTWAVPMKPSLSGIVGMIGCCETLKIAKTALTDDRIAGQVNQSVSLKSRNLWRSARREPVAIVSV